MKPRGGLSTNGMTVYVEVVSTGRGIPEFEITANPGGVLGDKIRDGCLGIDTRVVPQKVDGKGQEKEMGFLRMARNEGTPKKSHLKHVFAEVISKSCMEWIWMRKEDGREWSRLGMRLVHEGIRININLKTAHHFLKI
jgi:hypothetical protein